MGVIVSEFEVVTEPPPAGAEGAAGPAASGAEPAPQPALGATPDDVRRVMSHRERRMRRLWAH
jgi:hypothetical protein